MSATVAWSRPSSALPGKVDLSICLAITQLHYQFCIDRAFSCSLNGSGSSTSPAICRAKVCQRSGGVTAEAVSIADLEMPSSLGSIHHLWCSVSSSGSSPCSSFDRPRWASEQARPSAMPSADRAHIEIIKCTLQRTVGHHHNAQTRASWPIYIPPRYRSSFD